MSSSSTFAQSETEARQAEWQADDGRHRDAALAATVNAVELYMKALKLADNAADRKRIDGKCKQLLSRAEAIKKAGTRHDSPPFCTSHPSKAGPPVSTRELSKREQIILLEGGMLNGFKFKAWDGPPDAEEFGSRNGGQLFTDDPALPLSRLQLESFAGWKRPQEALASIPSARLNTTLNIPTMTKGSAKIDLVQDMTSDCSVVASLCAGTARAEKGHSKLLRTIVFPYDNKNETPFLSANGKYVLRMYFNGCWRRVQVDDRLPTSSSSRVLHVIDRNNPGLLWPALVEKAYLKVRGGYDFPGSNSGTDLAVITGWIPQQVFLHDDDVEQDKLWATLYTGFMSGDVLLTMGTGKLPKREQRLLGLASEHDYAVLNLKQNSEAREMLVKNPWSNGDVWHGASRRRPNPSQESSPSISTLEVNDSLIAENDEMTPGTFWMDFRSIFQHFENIYINWNPASFTNREDVHFTWNLANSNQPSNLFLNNPQFAVSSKKSGEVWLLLNRHFRTGDYSMATPGKNGYISLYLYKRCGERVFSSDGAMIRGPYVDSPNTLLKLDIPAGATYTAVVASQNLSAGSYNFSLSAFSRNQVSLKDAIRTHDYEHSVTAAWTRSTAGGNSDSRHYLQNPQFKIEVQQPCELAIILQLPSLGGSDEHEIHVKLLVVFTTGGRVARLRTRDVVASSGDYRRGSAVIQKMLDKGNYAVICSTFDPDQHASFKLDILSPHSNQIRLIPLPSESSGRLSIISTPPSFSSTTNRLLAPLSIPRTSRSIFVMRPSRATTARSASLFKVTLEEGQGPYKKILASSAVDEEEFSSISADIRIEDTWLMPEMNQPANGGLWLVIERMAQVSSAEDSDEAVVVEILAEERLELGSWGRGDG